MMAAGSIFIGARELVSSPRLGIEQSLSIYRQTTTLLLQLAVVRHKFCMQISNTEQYRRREQAETTRIGQERTVFLGTYDV